MKKDNPNAINTTDRNPIIEIPLHIYPAVMHTAGGTYNKYYITSNGSMHPYFKANA